MRKSINTRISLFAAALLSALAFAVPSAQAGTYYVATCNGIGTTAINNAWLPEIQHPSAFLYGNYCDTSGPPSSIPVVDYDDSLALRSVLGNLPAPTSAYLRFDAPANTALTAISGTGILHIEDDQFWRATLATDDGELDGCQLTAMDASCTAGGSLGYVGLNTSWVRFGAYCWSFCSGGGTVPTANAVLKSATVTITDNTAPVANTPTGELIGTVTGTKNVTLSGSDSTGIKRIDLLIDGNQIYTSTKTCDHTYPAPCAVSSTSWAQTFSVSVGSMTNGVHTVGARVHDTAGNTSTASASFTVANPPPPTPPTGPTGSTAPPVTPTPTPTPTPPAAPADPALKLVSASIRKKRLRVTSSTLPAAAGYVEVVVAYRDAKKRSRKRTFRSVRSGSRFVTSRPLSAARASITVRFVPAPGWNAASIVRSLRARR